MAIKKDEFGYVIKTADDWWELFVGYKQQIIEILSKFFIENPVAKVEEAILKKDPEILRAMNEAWYRAPDIPEIHGIPGWKAFCDLMSEEHVFYEEANDENPIAVIVKELEALSYKYGKSPNHAERNVERMNGVDDALGVIYKNLAGKALVDVKDEYGDCCVERDWIEYLDKNICTKSGVKCPGLGNPGCPVFVTKRELCDDYQ